MGILTVTDSCLLAARKSSSSFSESDQMGKHIRLKSSRQGLRAPGAALPSKLHVARAAMRAAVMHAALNALPARSAKVDSDVAHVVYWWTCTPCNAIFSVASSLSVQEHGLWVQTKQTILLDMNANERSE